MARPEDELRQATSVTSRAPLPPWTFEGVVRLTRLGMIYLGFTVVIGFAAINTGNNSLYIGLTFMLGGFLLSGIASKGGLKSLHVELLDVESAWAGRRAHGRLRIANRSYFWSVRDVILIADELAEPLLVPLIRRHDSIEIGVSYLFHRRGRVTLERIDLYTRYPFGFILKKRRARIQADIVVFPRLLDVAAMRDRFQPTEGDAYSAHRVGPGGEIHSFREYVRGDSLRHVHWKKSAGLGRWIMKQMEMEVGRAVHIAIDSYKPHGVSDEAFEQMVSEAATMLFDVLQGDQEVFLTLPRKTLRGRHHEGGLAMFRELALLEPSHEPITALMERGTILFSVGRQREPKSA